MKAIQCKKCKTAIPFINDEIMKHCECGEIALDFQARNPYYRISAPDEDSYECINIRLPKWMEKTIKEIHKKRRNEN